MMDNAGVFLTRVFAASFLMSAAAYAQDEAEPAAEEAQEQELAPVDENQQQPAASIPLVRVVNIRGGCEVNNPDVGQFAPALENKAYPLGSVFRTGANQTAFLIFSARDSVQLFANTEVLVTRPEGNTDGRIVRLISGRIRTDLRDNLPEGSFGVETPNASCKNLSGRGDYTLSSDANGETLQIATVTGSARIEGPHYHIPALRAANIINIQTAADRSLSRLTTVSGDFAIILEKGDEEPVQFGMSPRAVVKIWRENAPVGGRAIISTLVVGPTGIARHRFAYAEGRANIATGELIEDGAADDMRNVPLPVLLSTEKKEDADEPAADNTADNDAQ